MNIRKYVIQFTFPDGEVRHLSPAIYKAKRLEKNPYRGFRYNLQEAQEVCAEYKEKYPECVIEAVELSY